MKSLRFLMCVLLAGTSLLVALPAHGSGAACAPTLVIGARGSGESATSYDGLGRTAAAAVEAFRADHATRDPRSLDVRSLDYPAEGVGWLAGGSFGQDVYFLGVDAGILTLKDVLRTQGEECPDQKFVLFGYSQGALVVNQALVQLAGENSPLVARVAGVGLLADPHRKGSALYTTGTAPAGRDGASWALRQYPRTDLPAYLQGKTISHCDKFDFICAWDGAGSNLRSGKRVHTSYWKADAKRVGKMVAGEVSTYSHVFIATAQLPEATAGVPYAAQFEAAGGKAPYRWSLLNAPRGWSLSSEGVLTGTPDAAGSLSVSVRVTDAHGGTDDIVAMLIHVTGDGASDPTPDEPAGAQFTLSPSSGLPGDRIRVTGSAPCPSAPEEGHAMGVRLTLRDAAGTGYDLGFHGIVRSGNWTDASLYPSGLHFATSAGTDSGPGATPKGVYTAELACVLNRFADGSMTVVQTYEPTSTYTVSGAARTMTLPKELTRGQTVSVTSVDPCPAGSAEVEVEVWAGPGPNSPATTAAVSSTGHWTVDLTVPSDLAAGPYYAKSICLDYFEGRRSISTSYEQVKVLVG